MQLALVHARKHGLDLFRPHIGKHGHIGREVRLIDRKGELETVENAAKSPLSDAIYSTCTPGCAIDYGSRRFWE